jgi:phosphoglycolate phosphatase
MKTIIFDFDGVLLDSFDTVLKELGTLHQKFNLPKLTEEKLSELFDGNFWENHKALGLSEESENKLKSELKDALARTQSEMPFFDSIKEILTELSMSFEIIILSSNHAENIENRFEKEGLRGIVKAVSGTETPGNKEEKIQKIIADANDSVIFVTDTKGDLLEAQDLDIIKVGVTWGYHSKARLLAGNPTIIINDPKELLEFLSNLH